MFHLHSVLLCCVCIFTVWPSSNNPANIQPNSVTVTLPSGQPSDVVYEVIDTITGRVLGSYPANSPRQQQFPVSPDQVYRFGIRARDPSTGQTSPTSSVLNFRSPSGQIMETFAVFVLVLSIRCDVM